MKTPSTDDPSGGATDAGTRRRRTGADDPAVPASRRELAHLLTDRLPAALTERGFADVKELVASTAVHPDYWRTLVNPKTAGQLFLLIQQSPWGCPSAGEYRVILSSGPLMDDLDADD